MKTPQEEASRLIHETVKPVMFFTETQQRLERHLAEVIPLPELIAVARAAAKVDLTDSECTCGSDPERSCRYCGYFIGLGNALQALRATGKVEL